MAAAYVLALAYFSVIFPIYAISFWLPTLLSRTRAAGTGSMHAGLFVMACVAALAAMLILKSKLTLKQA